MFNDPETKSKPVCVQVFLVGLWVSSSVRAQASGALMGSDMLELLPV